MTTIKTQKHMISWMPYMLLYVIFGLLLVVLMACYGSPIEEKIYKLVKIRTEGGDFVRGLQIKLYNADEEIGVYTTNELGAAEFEVPASGEYRISIDDVDGKKNEGLFESELVDISSKDVFEITLQRQNQK